MAFEINGMKELQAKLSAISKKAESLDGQKVPVSQLLSGDFVASCSRFSSAQELFDASGFQINSQDDFRAIPEDEWNRFIVENTTYQNWQAMFDSAAKNFVEEELKR